MSCKIDVCKSARANLSMGFALLIGLILIFGFLNCYDSEPDKILSASFFAGEHQISPMGFDGEKKFLFYNPKKQEYLFYWQNANNNYASFYEINEHKVYFEFDENYQEPKLRFRWKSQPANDKGQAVMYENKWPAYVIYIVIRGKPEHLHVK